MDQTVKQQDSYKTDIAKLLAKCVPSANGCIEWPKSRNQFGYGRSMVTMADGTHRLRSIHRLAYEHHIGHIPAKMLVMHTCDNRACANPAHLCLGTHHDNNWDSIKK